MENRHSTFMRALVVAVLCPFLLAGCTQTYVYGFGKMPKISDGNLQVREFQRSHAPTDSFEIERVGVRHLADPGLLRAPTDDEITNILSGHGLDAHLIIELDVDTGRKHWRDYGLGGAGVGVSLGLLSSLSREGNRTFGDSPLGIFLVSALLGTAGFMAGLIGGSLSAPDVVDMRHLEQFNPQ